MTRCRGTRLRDHGEVGATSVEYGVMAALVAGAIATSVTAFGQTVITLFVRFTTRMGW